MPDQHEAAHRGAAAIAQAGETGIGQHAARCHLGAQKGHGVAAQREAGAAVILHHLAALGHGGQCDRGIGDGFGKERQGGVLQRADRPERIAPVEAKAEKAIRLGQTHQGGGGNGRAAMQIGRCGIGPVALGHQALGMAEIQPARHAQAQANGRPLQRAIPFAVVDADRAHLHAMLFRVPHQLRRGVEAHGLAVQQGGAEHRRVVAFQPGAGIGDQREAGGMAFGKAIGAKALDLREGAGGEFRLIAMRHHAGDQLVAEMGDAAGHLEGGHGAAQLVGLAGGKPGADDGDLHGLLLEQRHAQRLAQHAAERFGGEGDRLAALPPAEIGVDHIALDRPGADNGHLNDQVIKSAGLHARQHGHLRPAFDLEGAHRVGPGDHAVGLGILGRDGGHIEPQPMMLFQQGKTAAEAAQHAQAQHIHLHHLQAIGVILVPFDHLALGHGGGGDGDEVIEPVARQHEAAGMGAELAGEADELAGEVERQPQPAVCHVEVERCGVLLLHPLIAPGPDLGGQGGGHILGQAHGLADIAHRAAGAKAHHRAAQRRTLAPVMLIDPLDHLLAPLMLEIDIDIGWLAPFGGDEALEEQARARGVDAGDAQHVAHRRIGRRTPALAKNPLAAGIAHDGVHGEEIRRVIQLRDKAEFVVELGAGGLIQALWVAGGSTRPGQALQRGLGGFAGIFGLIGVLVLQLAEVELAARDDLEAAGYCLGVAGEEAGGLAGRQQVAAGMAFQPRASGIDAATLPDAGDDILQNPPPGDMVEHIAGGQAGHARGLRGIGQPGEAEGIAGAVVQGEGEIGAVTEGLAQPWQIEVFARQLDGDEAAGVDILPGERKPPMAAARAAEREQPAQPRPGRPVLRVEQQRRRIRQINMAASHQPHPALARCLPGADHAGERIAVHHAQGRNAQFRRAGKKLGRVAGAAQEGVIRGDLEFGVAHRGICSVVLGAARSGRFISTKPLARRWRTSRSAVTRAMAVSASCTRRRPS